jgi:hypothetical protein
MKALWRGIRWVVLIVFLLLLGGALYFGSVESYTYLTRSEGKAQAAAQEEFTRICDQQQLDPHSFHGPDRADVVSDEKLGIYTFVWTRASDEKIYVHVTYLPYDLPYSISATITERKRDTGSQP